MGPGCRLMEHGGENGIEEITKKRKRRKRRESEEKEKGEKGEKGVGVEEGMTAFQAFLSERISGARGKRSVKRCSK